MVTLPAEIGKIYVRIENLGDWGRKVDFNCVARGIYYNAGPGSYLNFKITENNLSNNMNINESKSG